MIEYILTHEIKQNGQYVKVAEYTCNSYSRCLLRRRDIMKEWPNDDANFSIRKVIYDFDVAD